MILLSVVVLLSTTACKITKTTPEARNQLASKIENKHFTVVFNYANPFRMQQVPLTGADYNLKISGDSVYTYLPYYGVAHTAPFNPSDGGVRLATVMNDFSMNSTKKSDGWEMKFKANSEQYHYMFYLTTYENGSSTLQVSSAERDPISYYGEIKTE
ncbi:MAG: DUF4251 domain-containing protein [Paludibacter sp.]|nr:DUF4251 domain-containing protein [Paludibacter sp.]